MIEKTFQSSGADERTPSRPQYFSWINNTNEGSTQAQTLINLDYFRWLHDTYGMELMIYAWDAGNLDGAAGTYEHPATSPKLQKQYPEGYAPLAKAAARFGCHLGVWAGADGFGDTPEEQQKRYDLIVGLCRDYGFMEFKFDTVCGQLRPEKRTVFKSMIDECRRYVPGLVVLNHRNNLGEAEICATTFLWGGAETYIDVFSFNDRITGSHHRVGTLTRGLVPGMKRLTEDHGVCISSCLDFFEDDLIIQGFARSLILAPEVYGNPWLLRDAEQGRMAHIYNLHRRYADILVNGMELPDAYGKNAVSRGSGDTRLLVFANPNWKSVTITITLSAEIGLDGGAERYVVKSLHPYEALVGIGKPGETLAITVEPFRAALILVQAYDRFIREDFVLTNCACEPVDGSDGLPCRMRIMRGDGQPITALGNRRISLDAVKGDHRLVPPQFLGRMQGTELPDNTRQLYEATCFAADTDALEAQSRKRSGKTVFPAVQAARDAFFAQETYRARGCEAAWMFDDRDDTYFDGESVYYRTRLDGGCLRVDLGQEYRAAVVEIEFFVIDEPIKEVWKPILPAFGEISSDLNVWTKAVLTESFVKETTTAPVVRHRVHNIERFPGTRKVVRYQINGAFRYFSLPFPMDRIYHFRLLDEAGNRIPLENPHANNILAPFSVKRFAAARTVSAHVPADAPEGSYIAIAVDGVTGTEGVYCAAMRQGMPFGCSDRAPSFPVNNWEHVVATVDGFYTYYLRVQPAMRGHDVAFWALFTASADADCTVWLCDGNDKTPIAEVDV